MKRRNFLILTALIAWPFPAPAQEPRRLIGHLSGFPLLPSQMAGFLQGLKDTGFIEGRNLDIEYRSTEGQYDRLPSLAAELVDCDVAVIFCNDVPSAFAAKAATRTIPIVFVTGADPVRLGLVDSISRPGGNLTGVSVLLSALGPKRLELLSELLPTALTIILLTNPRNPNVQVDAPEIQAAADALGQHLEVLTASTEGDLEAAFVAMVKQRAGALMVMPDAFFIARRNELVALAARHAMPAIYPLREFVEAGGLISYGNPVLDRSYQTGVLTGKILKGSKPAVMPIQQITKFELIINLKTAKTLGLAVPASLLARADEVIE